MFKHLPDSAILTQALDDLFRHDDFDGETSLSQFRQTICSYLVFITDYCLFISITGGDKVFENIYMPDKALRKYHEKKTPWEEFVLVPGLKFAFNKSAISLVGFLLHRRYIFYECYFSVTFKQNELKRNSLKYLDSLFLSAYQFFKKSFINVKITYTYNYAL